MIPSLNERLFGKTPAAAAFRFTAWTFAGCAFILLGSLAAAALIDLGFLVSACGDLFFVAAGMRLFVWARKRYHRETKERAIAGVAALPRPRFSEP